MSGKAWISGLMTNSQIGNKLGLRAKFHGEDWQPAQHKVILPNDRVMAAHHRHTNGFHLDREEFPDALAVFDEKCFEGAADIFAAGPFYAVKGKIAEILSKIDLGEGSLIPLTIYESDLITPREGNFFLINFGCRKQSFLPEKSNNISKFTIVKKTGQQLWAVNAGVEDEDIALSPLALNGPDLWFEEAVWGQLFISNRLAEMLRSAGMAADFRLKTCRIVGGAQ